jgi:putative aldouronate transport system substrate-binding protein
MKLPDGHEYSLPKVVLSEPNAMSRRAWINQKWLDNLGLKTPTTTDELLTVLKAFKEKDPNGNNKADEIAFMGSKNGWSAYPEEFILNSFIKFNRSAPYYLDNGKFEAAYDKDAYREGLKYMHKLCAVEGLLDPASYTQDNDQLKQLFDNVDNALVGLATGGGTFIWAPMDGERVKEYAPLAPLKGPAGVQYSFYDPFGSYYLNEYIITSACKNPEVAFKFADFMYSRDVSMRNRLGEPGVDYAIPSNNEMGVDGKPATYDPILVWGKINSSHWNEIGPTYNDFDNNGIKGDDPYELQQYLWNATLNFYAPYKPPVEMCHNSKIYFKADQARRLSEIDTDLKSFVRSALAEFVTGVRNPNDDKQWEAYLKELKALGYEEYISINQARYDSMK